MAKTVSLSDVLAMLKPMQETLSRIVENQSSHSVQVTEMHAMLTSLSVKMDTIEQSTGAALSEVTKPAAKRASTRKPTAKKAPAAKKAPMKRGSKAKAAAEEETAEEEAAEEEHVEEEHVEEVEEDVVETADDEEEEHVEEDEEDEDSKKKASVKKAPPKKAGKKPAAKKVAPPRTPNKMILFKDTFKSNPEKFDKYLTTKVKQAIAKENADKWEDLSTERLATAQCNAYYHYMKDKHDDVLEALKTE